MNHPIFVFAIFISLLLSIHEKTFSQNITFVKEHGFWVGNYDTSRIGNYFVKDDWIYYFTSNGTPHRGYRYYFQIAYLKDSIENPVYLQYYSETDFLVLKFLNKTFLTSYYDFSSNQLSVFQNFIIIDYVMHLRDSEDHSFQFTLDGKFLGRFPNFSENYPEYSDDFGEALFINNKLVEYPYTIFDIQYFGYVFLESSVLLISKDKITNVNKDELNQYGNDAIHIDLMKDDIDFNGDLDRHSIVPLIDNLFLLNNKSIVYLYKVDQDLGFIRLQEIETPKSIGSDAKFFYPYLYQSEVPINFELVLQRYKIEGLQEASGISADLWYLYE